MRFFLGSDIIANRNRFGIAVIANNCAYSGATIITTGGNVTLTFMANEGFKLPSSVTSLVGATGIWSGNDSTRTLTLSNPEGEVYVNVTAIAKIYGVSGVDLQSTTLTRTDDAIGMSAVVNSSSGMVSSDFDSLFPWNEATIEIINGNKFLHMPDMWFRIGKSGSDDNISDIAVSKTEHALLDEDHCWYKVDSFYYSCYGGSVIDNKLASVSGVARQHSSTRAEFRTFANNNGSGYFQLDLYHHTVMKFLWLIEFANKDSQSIMTGAMSLNQTKLSTGGTDLLSTPSGFNTETRQMRWHFIEDFVGNYQEFVDGTVGTGITGGMQYVTADTSKYSDSITGLNVLCYDSPEIENVITGAVEDLGWDDNNPFLVLPKNAYDPNSGGYGYNIWFCDYCALNNGCVLYVGSSSPGGHGGVFNFTRGASNTKGDFIGGRLLYKPVENGGLNE